MSNYEDQEEWVMDSEGFWKRPGDSAPWEPPYAEYPVDYSAEHDHDRDNFFESDETEVPPMVKTMISVLSGVIVLLIALSIIAVIGRVIFWAVM